MTHDLEHLASDHRSEHVQHLMALIAIAEKPLGGRPHLGRVVGPELIGDYLVHSDVEYWVDGVATDSNFAPPLLEGTSKFGVFGFDQQAPLVLVGWVQRRQIDAIHFTFGSKNRELLSLFVVHHAQSTRVWKGPC